MYLCEVEKEKLGANTYEDMDTFTNETVYPDEGNGLVLQFIHM